MRLETGRMRLLNADELKEALIEAGQNSGGEWGKDWNLTWDQIHKVIDYLPDVKFAYICDKTRCEKCIYPWCKETSDIEHAAHFKKVQENIYYEREIMNDQNIKADYGKAKLSLVPRRIIWDVAAIREYGEKKYGSAENWKAVEPERYRDAAYRHFMKYLDDPEGVDKESGLPHLWHLACNIAFLCELEEKK